EVGEGTEDREHEPCQTHDHEALTHGDPGRAVYQAPPEDPEDEGDGSRDRDLPGHPVFAVGDGHQCGDADCRGDEHEDASEDPHQDAEQRVPLRRVGGAHALKIAEDSSMASGTAKEMMWSPSRMIDEPSGTNVVSFREMPPITTPAGRPRSTIALPTAGDPGSTTISMASESVVEKVATCSTVP